MRCARPPPRSSRVSSAAPSLRFRGFSPTGPRATSVSAPRGDGFRPPSAHARTRRWDGHRFLTRWSPVRRTRVARSGTQIIYVRRILLGRSLPSPPGDTAPPLARQRRNNESSSVR
ncbi:conserved hypothetical protein [Streptomyces lividans TK24]|nr:conserved hypothetical protein [Streptomyces lividans TK24]